MPLSDDYIKELFASDAFKDAVKEYLKENLRIEIAVNNGAAFEQRDNEVNVEVKLSLASDDEGRSWTHRDTSFTSASDYVTVKPGNDNPW